MKKLKDVQVLYNHLNKIEDINKLNGTLTVKEGKIEENVSLLHARSIAEDIVIYDDNREYFSGFLNVIDGKIQNNVSVEGKSLVHSAPLTQIAFDRGFFGNYGNYIVSIGLLLFAFSTAIAWSYYGDRAMTYLFGAGSVLYYRIVYVIGFFIASFADTTVIWNVSLITIALMTIPIIGLYG